MQNKTKLLAALLAAALLGTTGASFADEAGPAKGAASAKTATVSKKPSRKGRKSVRHGKKQSKTAVSSAGSTTSAPQK